MNCLINFNFSSGCNIDYYRKNDTIPKSYNSALKAKIIKHFCRFWIPKIFYPNTIGDFFMDNLKELLKISFLPYLHIPNGVFFPVFFSQANFKKHEDKKNKQDIKKSYINRQGSILCKIQWYRGYCPQGKKGKRKSEKICINNENASFRIIKCQCRISIYPEKYIFSSYTLLA